MSKDIAKIKAGTGKILLALAAALELRFEYRQIFLARPIVPLSNRDLGFTLLWRKENEVNLDTIHGSSLIPENLIHLLFHFFFNNIFSGFFNIFKRLRSNIFCLLYAF